MEFPHPVQLKQLTFFWEGCPQCLGVCLLKYLTILQEKHMRGQQLMLTRKVWLIVSAPINPKGVLSCSCRTASYTTNHIWLAGDTGRMASYVLCNMRGENHGAETFLKTLTVPTYNV